jgi:hypothetical protein
MPADYLHHHPQFGELIRIVAEEKGIDPSLVEKDYWIMHCLYGLQQLKMKFELKGGTSLSKGHKIIGRFSEDIDIRIEPPSERNVATRPNQGDSGARRPGRSHAVIRAADGAASFRSESPSLVTLRVSRTYLKIA